MSMTTLNNHTIVPCPAEAKPGMSQSNITGRIAFLGLMELQNGDPRHYRLIGHVNEVYGMKVAVVVWLREPSLAERQVLTKQPAIPQEYYAGQVLPPLKNESESSACPQM